MATKIYIVYYSTWGHVATLAEEMKKGADSVPGVEVTVWRVPETLREEDHPIITASQLAEADGILFGFPTRVAPRGASPSGAGPSAGADGSRVPSDAELALAAHQGKYFAGTVKKLKAV
ncbi:Flavoprotein wrbA [Triticum urartu]|uniref:Flavoprotein wrbA n=1 Tax=Triticum urartu TaxID=4572 RepID=M8ASY3_TRIUA|nr:Flavoprotein wrbA [Triticum urartu]